MIKYAFAIGIIICDKDYKYLNDLISNIESNIDGSYHIIIYNNCDKLYDELQSRIIPNTTILSNTYKHKNARQVYARKEITEVAYSMNTDYIWFIDGDDSVIDVKLDEIPYHTDIIIFPYTTDGNMTGWCPLKEEGIFKVELTPTHSEYIERPLWCKFIKTDIYKKVYDMIDAKNLPPISCSEDTLASVLSMKFAKTMSRYSKTIYYHNVDRSNSDSPETHINDIEQSTIGIKEILILLDTLFTKEEFNSLRLDLLKFGTISWVVDRICTIQNQQELQQALKSFNEKLGQKYIKQYLKHVKQTKQYTKKLAKLNKKYKSVIAPERATLHEANMEV